MLVGRLTGASIGSKVSSKTMLITVSSLGLFFILMAILLPVSITVSIPFFSVPVVVPISIIFLVLCGLCTSIMWGGIFNLAVEGLGKYTAAAAGVFMVMVCGGGIIPLVQGFVSDKIGYMSSYWVIFICLVYMLWYALIGCKNVNKDIPVEE
jgi:FHS family L-fucose permease-like MFS transporter